MMNDNKQSPFQLSACAEMLWLDQPFIWRVQRLNELGFVVGFWHWLERDITALKKTGAKFSIMNGYAEGNLTDDSGIEALLKSIQQAINIGKELGLARLNLHGTGLDQRGMPVKPQYVVDGAMWLKARHTLELVCDLAAKEGVVFTLENLNRQDHPACPFAKTSDVLALVSAINRPELRINLDLYHTQLGEGDLIGWCQRCLPWLGEVQVADNPGRYEPSTGEINYKNIANALFDMGYSGAVGLEGWAKGDSEAALAAFKEAFTI